MISQKLKFESFELEDGTREGCEWSLATERACDPAKVDDAALCQIASLAAEHKGKDREGVIGERVANSLQK